jgi:hypothetical protein
MSIRRHFCTPIWQYIVIYIYRFIYVILIIILWIIKCLDFEINEYIIIVVINEVSFDLYSDIISLVKGCTNKMLLIALPNSVPKRIMGT